MKSNVLHTTDAVHRLLAHGLDRRLPAPFHVDATEYRAGLTFNTTDDLVRWVDAFTLDAPTRREDSNQWVTSISWAGVEVVLVGFAPRAVAS